VTQNVKMNSSLPDGDRNGLASMAARLVAKPDEVHIAFVVLETSRLVTDVATGSVQPVVKVTAIEPIGGGEDGADARRIIQRAFERRTGLTELPLELTRDLGALGTDLAAEGAFQHGDDTFGAAAGGPRAVPDLPADGAPALDDGEGWDDDGPAPLEGGEDPAEDPAVDDDGKPGIPAPGFSG